MKFQELIKADNLRNKTYVDFENKLTKFRLKYKDKYDFNLDYSDNEHLIVLVENIMEYNKEIHEDLSKTFNVKLVYVNHLKQQSVKGHYLTVEYIYKDSDSVEHGLNWNDIILR